MARFNHQMLRQIRLDLGLTQEQAAAAVGMDARTYRRYESGAVNRGGDYSVRHSSRRKILRSLCEQFGVEDESAWLLEPTPAVAADSSPAAAPLTPCMTHPLTRARYFTGREAFREQLVRWHADAAAPERVIAVVAVGGTGKTALVERFLRERGPDPGGVMVWSFYEDPRASALLDRALSYFAGAKEERPGGQVERLIQVLGQGSRHLLILDGLEAVQSEGGDGRAPGEVEDLGLRRLLRALAAGICGGRVLATSRFELVDLAPWEGQGLLTLHLPDLSGVEAHELLRSYGVQSGPELQGLLERVGCHALSVAMAGSYAGAFFGGNASAVTAALEPALAAMDDPLARRLRAVLSAYTQALSEPERELMCRLAVLPHGASLDLLRSVIASPQVAGSLLGLEDAGLLRLLHRLGTLGLVSPGPLHTLHPFVREHFRGLLGVPASLIHEIARRRVEAELGGRPGARISDPGLLDRFESLLEHTFHSGRSLAAWQIYLHTLRGFNHLGLRLGEMVRGARILRLLDGADSSGRANAAQLPAAVRAQVAYDRGLYESALGDLASAERYYFACLEHAAAAGGALGQRLVTTTRRTIGYNTWLRGELPRATHLVAEAVAAAEEEGDHQVLARTLALASALAQDRGQMERAGQLFAQAQQLEPGEPEARRGLWLAEYLMGVGQHAQAKDMVQRNLARCQQRGWAGLVAHGHTVLGHLVLQQNGAESAAAAEHLREALGWARRTGEVEMVLRCHVLAAELTLREGRGADAHKQTHEGLTLARPSGFGLFTIRLLNAQATAQLVAGDAKAAEKTAEESMQTSIRCDYALGHAAACQLLAAARMH